MGYVIPQAVLEANSPVFAWQIGDEKVYVKQRRARKNMFGRRMQRLLYAVVGNALAVPAAIPGDNNVTIEVANLRKMASLGANVPKLLHAEENYFVMSDTGQMLNAVLRKHPEKREVCIVKTIHELRRFHDLGLAHGGTQAKNITVLNDEIYFIDCEESIPEENLEALKVRDLFLFLLSLQRDGYDPDLVRLCALYDGEEKGHAFTTIRRAIRIAWPLRIVKWHMFDSISMRDVRTMYAMYCKARGIRGD